jgi:hypothetical protein
MDELESITGYGHRLIKDKNTTRYKIDGEPAGAFTYVVDSKDIDYTEPMLAYEKIITIHNGYAYSFEFDADPEITLTIQSLPISDSICSTP